MTILPEEKRTGNDNDGSEPPAEDTFFGRMRAEEDQRREFAEAFARENSARPRISDVVESQQKNADQIARLHHAVGRLQRNILVTNFVVGSVALALLAFAVILYVRPDTAWNPTGGVASDTGSAERPRAETERNIAPDLVLALDSEFEIRTDVDRKYQLIIRQLYVNAGTIRRPDGPIEIRNAATADYIQYMADVSRVSEEAAADQASPEILRAIINLALIGPELRKVNWSTDVNVATRNKMDQIKAVLRARDVRSEQPIGIGE